MFREAPITPIRPEVATLAQAVIALVAAESDLARARAQVPDYTAQYDPKDYYAQEQEDWNQAAQGLYTAIHGERSK